MRKITARKLVLLSGCAVAVIVGGALLSYKDELVAWYEFFRSFESLGRNEQGYLEYRHRKTGIVFVRLPGGTFTMGTSDAEAQRWVQYKIAAQLPPTNWISALAREQPAHRVTVRSFLMAKHEVTQKQWSSLMSSNPSAFRGDLRPVDGRQKPSDVELQECPVEPCRGR